MASDGAFFLVAFSFSFVFAVELADLGRRYAIGMFVTLVESAAPRG